MSEKNEDNNPSLVLKEYSHPCVEGFCLGQSCVSSKQFNEAGAPSYECSSAAQSKYWIILP